MIPVTRLGEENLLAKGNLMGGKCHCSGDGGKAPVWIWGTMPQKSRGCLCCGADAVPTSRLGGHGRSRHRGPCPRCLRHLSGLKMMVKGKTKQNMKSNPKVKEQTATCPGGKGGCGMPEGELSLPSDFAALPRA